MSRLKVRDLIKHVKSDGWREISQKGIHRQYKHPLKRGRVTIPGHPADDVAPGTLKSVYRQAQIEKENQ